VDVKDLLIEESKDLENEELMLLEEETYNSLLLKELMESEAI
jgi:hypothetical protein